MIRTDVEITNPAPPVGVDAIRAAFDGANFAGNDDLINFYSKYNGGKPNKNSLTGKYNSTIRYFFSVSRRFIESVETIEETNKFYRSRLDLSRFFIDYIIFSIDEGGNVHCIRLCDGRVFFIPLDSGSDLEKLKVEVAKEFGDFINNLDYYDNVFE